MVTFDCIRRTMAAKYLIIISLLQTFCTRYSAITMQQPSAVAALVGSTVNLSCHMILGTETVKRVNLYWYVHEHNTTNRNYVYPDAHSKYIITKDSSWLSNPSHSTDMSFTISNVRLSYTYTYLCHTSLLFNSGSRTSTGRGTYLLVYDNLKAYVNGTDIICRIDLQEVEHVTLVWEFEGRGYKNNGHDLISNSRNSYWIANHLSNGTTQCQAHRNVTFTCLLQYKGESLLNHSIDITCTGGIYSSNFQGELKASHPVLLYSLVLGNSIVILIFVLVFFFLMKKRWQNRRNKVALPDPNIAKYRKIRQHQVKLQN
ncbi:uncharacterized protein LOC142107621 isoform X3 [Mixophyes fleayi]|uniref:uncharacterized protein LOC142107621 isoform X3 n=1 Tax=Mixophyes fleayi TaxID=3061075 RepID=UPI003F4D7E1D